MTEQKDHFAGFVRLKFDYSLNGSARIQTGAVTSAEAFSLQGRGPGRRSVAPNELFAIAGHGKATLTVAGQHYSTREFVVVRVARKHRSSVLFPIPTPPRP